MNGPSAAPEGERAAEADSRHALRDRREGRRRRVALLASIFLVAACGLAYELLVGTATAYLRGDTIVQFSITIGLFMASMGLGAHLSRRIRTGLLPAFLVIEIALALAGGLSTTLIFAAEVTAGRAMAMAVVCLVVVGALVGADLPLVARLLMKNGGVRSGIADALSLDYVGGLVAALAFPLLLLPALGVLRSAMLFGALNLAVVAIALAVFRNEPIPGRRWLSAGWMAGMLVLATAFVFSGRWLSAAEARLYGRTITHTLQTRHQRAVLTRTPAGTQLYLNGHLQFSSYDEHRYHEALVHPAMGGLEAPRSVLVVGGGDGLAAREVLKYPSVERVVLVDLDRELVDWVAEHPDLAELHGGALDDPRLERVHTDGFAWVRGAAGREPFERFDAVLIDLPDPSDIGITRLYTTEFYAACRSRLVEGGALAVQATSPYHAPKTFWTILATVREAGFPGALPMRVWVPSFGDWGFVLAANGPRDPRAFEVRVETKWLTPAEAGRMFHWPADYERHDMAPVRLGDPGLAATYGGEWTRWQ